MQATDLRQRGGEVRSVSLALEVEVGAPQGGDVAVLVGERERPGEEARWVLGLHDASAYQEMTLMDRLAW